MFIKKTQRKKKIMVFTQNLQNQMMNRKTAFLVQLPWMIHQNHNPLDLHNFY